MFMTHHAPPNGLDPGDRMPGADIDPMAGLMGDWSWQPQRQLVDPGYVYDEQDREAVSFMLEMREFPGGKSIKLISLHHPFPDMPVYRGPVDRPRRIGPHVG